ncbi:MAG TPA: hypothetical protein VMP67_12805 [Candidatus Limnocylindria bacterium]|nr:hypothetical protein [Candidatus Limnocylindria bacterium]
MNRILVSVFNDENSAYEGLSALKDLHARGDITLYASAFVAKDATGVAEMLDVSDRTPPGVPVGIVAGSLAGVIAGPAAMVAGGIIGSLGGLLYDLFHLGIDLQLVDDVEAALEPGTVALVADLDEARIAPVETRLAGLGAVSFRRTPAVWLGEQLNREVELTSAEFARLRAERDEAEEDMRAPIQQSIDNQVATLERLGRRIDERLDQSRKEFEGRVATLRSQRQKASEHRKADIDARIAELKADYEAREVRLALASQRAEEVEEMRDAEWLRAARFV